MANLSRTHLIAGGAAVVVLAGLGAGLAAYVLRDTQAEAVDHRTDDAEAVQGARIAVADRFPEAQGVDFGKTFVHWDGEIPSVCGEVDIVEEQDGFDGPERFVWSQGDLKLEETDGSDALDQSWSDLCV
ncbi:hypothetical protein [Caulobacter sp. UNC358MFTsu5.1]|uniref:hypothetical protein n=1 Tax=Caulobacter sp. UNC358MFTsu5.1 TaxID=1449049 RepID=UPI000552306A|nr:hypothetical protein [Caulobacter sp. UNC358MFTsu5.1]